MNMYKNSFAHDPSQSCSEEDVPTAPKKSGDFIMRSTIYKSNVANTLIDAKFNEVYINSMKQGRKTFTFWTIFLIMLIIAVGNLILTLTIIGVLKLGKGIHGIELIPEEDAIKFYGETDLELVYLKSVSQVNGFFGNPVSITSDYGDIVIRLNRNGQAHDRVLFNNHEIHLNGINTFELKDSNSGVTIFSTHRPHYNIRRGVNEIKAKIISAAQITSSIDDELLVVSDGKINVRGSEGILIDSLVAGLQSEHHIFLNSTRSAIKLDSGNGTFLDIDKMPIASSEMGIRTGQVQFKICVCMPHGNLFQIAVPRIHNGPLVSCANFESTNSPCTIN